MNSPFHRRSGSARPRHGSWREFILAMLLVGLLLTIPGTRASDQWRAGADQRTAEQDIAQAYAWAALAAESQNPQLTAHFEAVKARIPEYGLGAAQAPDLYVESQQGTGEVRDLDAGEPAGQTETTEDQE